MRRRNDIGRTEPRPVEPGETKLTWIKRGAEQIGVTGWSRRKETRPIAGIVDVIFEQPDVAVWSERRMHQRRNHDQVDKALVQAAISALTLGEPLGQDARPLFQCDQDGRGYYRGRDELRIRVVDKQKYWQRCLALQPRKMLTNSLVPYMGEEHGSFRKIGMHELFPALRSVNPTRTTPAKSPAE